MCRHFVGMGYGTGGIWLAGLLLRLASRFFFLGSSFLLFTGSPSLHSRTLFSFFLILLFAFRNTLSCIFNRNCLMPCGEVLVLFVTSCLYLSCTDPVPLFQERAAGIGGGRGGSSVWVSDRIEESEEVFRAVWVLVCFFLVSPFFFFGRIDGCRAVELHHLLHPRLELCA